MSRGARYALALAAALVAAAALWAAWPRPTPGQRDLEAEVRAVARSLACVVCQGQTIWDSRSAWARQRLEEIRAMLAAGMTREQVIAAFVERYGPAVLMVPPARGLGLLAWLGPLLGAAAAAGLAAAWWRSRRHVPPGPAEGGHGSEGA